MADGWKKHGDWDKKKHGDWDKSKQYNKGKGGKGHQKYWGGANAKKTDHREQADGSQRCQEDRAQAIENLFAGQIFCDDPDNTNAYVQTGKVSPKEKRYVTMEVSKPYLELLTSGDFRCKLCHKKSRLASPTLRRPYQTSYKCSELV